MALQWHSRAGEELVIDRDSVKKRSSISETLYARPILAHGSSSCGSAEFTAVFTGFSTGYFAFLRYHK